MNGKLKGDGIQRRTIVQDVRAGDVRATGVIGLAVGSEACDIEFGDGSLLDGRGRGQGDEERDESCGELHCS
jgi:hypothetical protein